MSETDFRRADTALTEAGLAASRTRAQALIGAGLAYAGGVKIEKSAQKIPANAHLEVRGTVCPYVSRGGFKLAKALDSFAADVHDAVAIDVGASTGGFTDVLLQNGARLVYAVDVGQSQLDAKLDADPRVVRMDHVNARELTAAMFPETPRLAVMDVSFISILKILPALRNVLCENRRVISLVKPQFEAGPRALNRHGVVADPAEHVRVLTEIAAHAPLCGWRVRALEISPITGGDGNIEFLADLVPDDGTIPLPDPQVLRDLVRRAHAQLREQR